MGISTAIRHDPLMRTQLNRIIGQVHGVVRMVEDSRYCIEIIDQIRAVKAALKQVEAELLKDQVDRCAAESPDYCSVSSQKQKFSELTELFDRYGK